MAPHTEALASARRVDVWIRPVDILEDLSRCLSILSTGERDRADRFHRAVDRTAYVVAHALLRQALSWHVPEIPEATWVFTTEPGGRSVLAPPHSDSNLRFSISHCQRAVACAVGCADDVGVDLEPLGRALSTEVARRCFTKAEHRHCGPVETPSGQRELLKRWTLKEAYLKARGEGLSWNALEQVGFPECDGDRVSVEFGTGWSDRPACWWFTEWQQAGCQVALAVRTEVRQVMLHRHEQ